MKKRMKVRWRRNSAFSVVLLKFKLLWSLHFLRQTSQKAQAVMRWGQSRHRPPESLDSKATWKWSTDQAQDAKTGSLWVGFEFTRLFIIIIIIFCCTGDLNSGPCACYAAWLYYLSHSISSFCFSYFSDRVSCFLPRLTLDLDPPTYASGAAVIIGVYHHAQLVCWKEGVSLTFFLDWTWTAIPSIFASWVAGITGMSHYAQLCLAFLKTDLTTCQVINTKRFQIKI
jgi:hypothetical protein